MQTLTRPRRTESPERWRAALERAIQNGIEPLQIAGTGEWVVTSATRLGTVYRSDGTACECEAALALDPICQHRAAVRFVRGLLAPDPEPEPPAAAAPGPVPTPIRPALCVCDGRGYLVKPSTLVADQTYRVTCRACRGSGFAPVALPDAA